MAKNRTYEELHVIYSPQNKEDLETNRKKLISRLNQEGEQWILSEESGEAEGITHFDIIIWLKKEQRTDHFNNKLRRDFKLIKGTDEYNIACKTYGIEDIDSLKWYVGYNRKEGHDFSTSDPFEFDIEKAQEYYENNELVKKKQVSNWNKDRIAREYVSFLKKNKAKHDEEVKWNWMKKHINNISLTNCEKIMESKSFDTYLLLNGIETNTNEYKSQTNVLGLIEEDMENYI